MPYDYRTVKDQYDMLYDAGVVTEPLEKWSARKNYETGTDAYSAGMEDNFIKRASVGVDRFLESTGLPGIGEKFGGAVGGLIGAEEAGAAIGKSLPRTAASMLPFLIPGVGVPLGTATMAASAGSEAYTATGSPASGLIAGTTAAAMPGVGNIARQAALKGMGVKAVEGQLVGGVDRLLAKAGFGTLTEEGAEKVTGELIGKLASGAPTTMAKEYIPKNLMQGLLAGTAENVAGSALGFAGGQLESVFSGQPYEFSPTTELLNMTVGQLPFAAMSATKHGRVAFGGRAAREHEARLQTSVDLSEKAIEQHRLNEEVSGKTDFEVVQDTPQEIADRAALTTRLVDLRERQRAAKVDGTTVAEEERQKLANADNAALSGLREKRPMAGHILGVPADSIPKRPVIDPTAPTEDPVIKLQTAEQRLAAVKDNVDFQDAIVEINEVRQDYGMTPLDDVEIVTRQRQLGLGSDKDAVQSHIDETRRLATAKEDGIALKAEIAFKKAELTHEDPMVRATAMGRLQDIAAASDKLDNVKRIANAPLNRDSAPLKGFTNEQAIKITESDPGVVPGDQQKFLDWVSGGITNLMRKHGMGLEAAGDFLNDNPMVNSWRSRLEMQVNNGLELTDYAQRHLMSQGILETEAKQKAAVVAELSAKPDLVNNILAVPTEGAETKKAAAELNNLLASEPEPTQQLFAEKGVASADELYNKYVASGKIDEADFVAMDGKVADYIYAKAREHKQLVDVMKSTQETDFVNSPVEPVDPVLGTLRKISDVEATRNRQAGELAGVGGIAPRTFMENVISGDYNPEFLDPVLGKLQGFKELFVTPAWLSKINPQLAEFVTKGHQLSANIRRMSMEAFKAFGMDERGNWDKKFIKSISDKQIRGAVSKWMGINNRIGSVVDAEGNSPGVVIIPQDHPEVARVLQGLPAEKRDIAIDYMNRQAVSTQAMQKQELGKMREVYAVNGTEFLGPRTGLKFDQNLRISNSMLDLIQTVKAQDADPNNPELAMQVQVMSEKLQMQFADKPEVYTEFYQVMGEKMLEYDKKAEFFEKNPAWATEQRYGKYIFTYQKGNKRVVDTADSKSEARDIANGNQIISIERNAEHDDTPVKYERQIPIEQADARWFDNHTKWLNKNATYWSRALYRAQKDALLADPELSKRPDVLRLAKQHGDNMLSPDPKFGSMANKIASNWFLGWNAASAMVNSTQLMVRGAAEMSKLTGNPVDSYKRIMGAYKEMYDMWMPGAKGLTEEKKKIVQRLERDGITTVTSEMFGGEEESGIELKRALAGKGGPLKSPGYSLSRVYQKGGMAMFRAMERVNNIGAVFAAYDLYRTKKGTDGKQLSFEDAYNRAVQFNQAVNDVGGKANRPINVMSGTGEASRSLGLMATSLQTYNIGSINQLVSYIRGGKFDPPDLAPGEKYHYKTALGHLLAGQFAAAGALGVPFVGTALALIHQAWPGLEIEEKFRGGINKFIDQFQNDDDEDGGVIADIAMGGVPSMFGWDAQSRLSMGNPVPGVSEINGFQPQMLFGTPSELVTKFLKGAAGVAAGEPPSSFVGDMIPPAAKKMLDVVRGQGKILDYNNKPILETPTRGEQLGLFLGFQPTTVAAHNKANRMINRSKAAADAQTERFNKEQAAVLVEKGGQASTYLELQKLLKARQQEEFAAGNTEYNIKTNAQQIINAATELAFPNDLRTKLRGKDKEIAKWFQLPLNLPSEQARAQYKAQLSQKLGVPYKPRDMVKYEIMDQIEAQNPGQYTRTDKRRMAEKAMGKMKTTPELAEPAG